MRSLLAGALVAALAAGCDAGPQVGSAPDRVTRAASAPQGAFDPDDGLRVAPGEVAVWTRDAGLAVLANAAPRLDVLQALRAETGFELEIADGAELGAPLSLRMLDVGLDEALAAVLAGRPHWLGYGGDPDTGERLLLAVRVGDALETAAAPPGDEASHRQARAGRSDPARRLSEGERSERYARRQGQYARGLESPDPATRAESAAWIHVDSRTLPGLGDALLVDPSPSVRAAAAETLGEAVDERDEREAAELLLEALGDPDPSVVIAALEALEWVGDAAVVPEIAPLLQHPDREVREQAVETIEWVED